MKVAGSYTTSRYVTEDRKEKSILQLLGLNVKHSDGGKETSRVFISSRRISNTPAAAAERQ